MPRSEVGPLSEQGDPAFADSAGDTRRPGAKSPWRMLLADPIFQLSLLVLAILAAPFFLPILSPEQLEIFSSVALELPMIALTIAALCHRLDRVDSSERRLWTLLAVAFAFWLAQRLVAAIDYHQERSDVAYRLLLDGLYVGVYAAFILALESCPRPRRTQTRISSLEALESAGTILFALGLFAYFAVAPLVLDPESYWRGISTLLLYVVLDIYLVLRLMSLRRAATSPRWRSIHSWLLAMAVLWLATDILEALFWAEALPWVPPGTPLDLLWLLPFVPILAVARWRTFPFDTRQGSTSKVDVLHSLWGGKLVVYAVAFPLVHFLFHTTGLLDEGLKPTRELAALVWLVLLAGLAVIHQTRLEVENHRLDADRDRMLAAIQHQAHHDPLTGLANRYLFQDRLSQALAQAPRTEKQVAVLFCDLDAFKQVNDSMGHSVGDRLLCAVAERIKGCLRAADTLARFGGDEFAIILQAISSVDDATTVAQKVLAAMRDPFEIEGHTLHATTSIGLSCYPEDGSHPEALLRQADLAMYRAKEAGRDGFQLP